MSGLMKMRFLSMKQLCSVPLHETGETPAWMVPKVINAVFNAGFMQSQGHEMLNGASQGHQMASIKGTDAQECIT